MRVLPPLVVETDRRAGFVLLEAVPVAVPVLEHPLEGGLGVRPVAVEDVLVAGPLIRIGEDDQEEQRRIRRAVVRREGKKAEARQLAVAQLVRDLAGLLVLLGVVIGRLHPREAVERAERELGKAADALHGDHERVPTKQGHVPWNTGRRDVDAALHGEVRHPERLHVGDCLPPDRRQRRVAGRDVNGG